jgi:hypothetical protein
MIWDRDLISMGAVLSPCGIYRYRLIRIWNQSIPVAVFVMLNPSFADMTINDPTIKRCMSFADRAGCGGIIVVNLYAFRATDPVDLERAWAPTRVGPDNDDHIATVVRSTQGPIIVAWGAHKLAPPRAQAVMRGPLIGHMDRVRCLGKTKDGAPKHPVRLAANTPLIPWP